MCFDTKFVTISFWVQVDVFANFEENSLDVFLRHLRSWEWDATRSQWPWTFDQDLHKLPQGEQLSPAQRQKNVI